MHCSGLASIFAPSLLSLIYLWQSYGLLKGKRKGFYDSTLPSIHEMNVLIKINETDLVVKLNITMSLCLYY